MSNFWEQSDLGVRLQAHCNVTGYRVPKIHGTPNSHLFISWLIRDNQLPITQVDFSIRYVQPALAELATRISEYDVALFTPLPDIREIFGEFEAPPAGVWCRVSDGVIPVRYTVQYHCDLTGKNDPGHRFTIDVLADLLTKPEIK